LTIVQTIPSACYLLTVVDKCCPFISEELIMAIYKPMPAKVAPPPGTVDITLPSLSYPDTDLPRVIVEVWNNPRHILDRDGANQPTPDAVADATALINSETGMNLTRAVIITEEEHDNDYTTLDENEIVFVLPKRERVAADATQYQLLESAKLLMACTPNGI
jgi:hypothetical protein